jgi:hypothetical protein
MSLRTIHPNSNYIWSNIRAPQRPCGPSDTDGWPGVEELGLLRQECGDRSGPTSLHAAHPRLKPPEHCSRSISTTRYRQPQWLGQAQQPPAAQRSAVADERQRSGQEHEIRLSVLPLVRICSRFFKACPAGGHFRRSLPQVVSGFSADPCNPTGFFLGVHPVGSSKSGTPSQSGSLLPWHPVSPGTRFQPAPTWSLSGPRPSGHR